MQEDKALVGFDELLAACQRTGYPVRRVPPGRHPPQAGTLVAGLPLDPLLARLYHRVGGVQFGGKRQYLCLHPVNDVRNDIITETEKLREPTEPFHSTILFGEASGLAWYYATVPALADEQGLQPVVFIDGYDERPVKPVASNLNRFFHVFARYVEMLARDTSHQRGDPPEEHFPEGVVEEVARDGRLVEMLEAGRFHFLLKHAPASQGWVEQVLAARE